MHAGDHNGFFGTPGKIADSVLKSSKIWAECDQPIFTQESDIFTQAFLDKALLYTEGSLPNPSGRDHNTIADPISILLNRSAVGVPQF